MCTDGQNLIIVAKRKDSTLKLIDWLIKLKHKEIFCIFRLKMYSDLCDVTFHLPVKTSSSSSKARCIIIKKLWLTKKVISLPKPKKIGWNWPLSSWLVYCETSTKRSDIEELIARPENWASSIQSAGAHSFTFSHSLFQSNMTKLRDKRLNTWSSVFRAGN